MSVAMAVTRAFLWLDTRGGRKALSRPDAAAHVDPHRKPAPVPRALRRRHDVTAEIVAGMEVTTIQPRGDSLSADVLYLHGGGYVSPIGAHHWCLLDRLVSASGARITVPRYPLAPEHTLDDALPPLTALYQQVRGRDTGRMVLAGDSSGGGVAVALALHARSVGLPAADGLLLFAPCVDATFTNPDTVRLEPRDPLLRRIGARDQGRAWAGRRPTTDPLVSPINANLSGLPPTAIIQGDRDILFPDVERFAQRARAAGVHVDLHIEPGGFHVYPVAYWTPEARHAYELAAASAISGRAIT